MDWGVIASAFVFGLTASISCLGLCIPILVPYIIEKDKTSKEGLITSIFFSMGRLFIYLAMGLFIFMIGSALTEKSPSTFLQVAVVILGCIVIVYGIWLYFRLPRPKWCPAKLAKDFRPVFSVILGLLIGSFFCPLLWIALVRATLTGDIITMFMSVFLFWMGSSVTILVAGTVSGEVGGRTRERIGYEKLRDVTSLVLIMVGAFYLISGLS